MRVFTRQMCYAACDCIQPQELIVIDTPVIQAEPEVLIERDYPQNPVTSGNKESELDSTSEGCLITLVDPDIVGESMVNADVDPYSFEAYLVWYADKYNGGVNQFADVSLSDIQLFDEGNGRELYQQLYSCGFGCLKVYGGSCGCGHCQTEHLIDSISYEEMEGATLVVVSSLHGTLVRLNDRFIAEWLTPMLSTTPLLQKFMTSLWYIDTTTEEVFLRDVARLKLLHIRAKYDRARKRLAAFKVKLGVTDSMEEVIGLCNDLIFDIDDAGGGCLCGTDWVSSDDGCGKWHGWPYYNRRPPRIRRIAPEFVAP